MDAESTSLKLIDKTKTWDRTETSVQRRCSNADEVSLRKRLSENRPNKTTFIGTTGYEHGSPDGVRRKLCGEASRLRCAANLTALGLKDAGVVDAEFDECGEVKSVRVESRYSAVHCDERAISLVAWEGVATCQKMWL